MVACVEFPFTISSRASVFGLSKVAEEDTDMLEMDWRWLLDIN